MNKQLVFSQNGNVYLNTMLTQSAFAKSRFAERLSEKGYLAEKTTSGWEFSSWCFADSSIEPQAENTSSKAESTVLLSNKAFNGLTLKNLFDLDFSKKLDDEEKARVIYGASSVCSAIEEAKKQNIKLPVNGAGGIFISDDFTSILFLPQDLFDSSASCSGDSVYSEYKGLYINKNLTGVDSAIFTQAVIMYRAITGSFPFTNLNTELREQDIRDFNYTPIKNRIWALDEKLASYIDEALHLVSAAKNNKQKPMNDCPLNIFYREVGLTEEGNIPNDGKLYPVIRKAAISQEQFEASVKKQANMQERSITVKRWFRKNKTILTIIACVIFFVGIVVGTVLKTNAQSTTTKGLTSLQTIEVFYSAINILDSSTANSCVTGRETKAILDNMASVFVSSQTRAAYDHKESTVSPAEWLLFNYDGHYNIFGLSQFYIKSTKYDLYVLAPTNNNHPPILQEEGGEKLNDNKTKDFSVSYFIVRNEDKDSLIAEEFEDNIQLVFKNNRWLIRNFKHNLVESKSYSLPDFIDEYKKAVKMTSGDVQKAADILRQSYEWLPTTSEILVADEYMKRKE